MKTSYLYILVAIAVLVAAFYALNSYIYKEKQAPAFKDYKTAYYVINGERVTLGEGGVEYFGNEIRADFDDDGQDDDVAFLITSQPGGSGTFYYAVAAINTDEGYLGSSAYFLGDRIAPQSTTGSENPAHVNVVAFNFTERAPGEPMSAAPSLGKSVLLKFDLASMQFGEVVVEFEGEAAPEAMTLQMKDWVWISALYNDGRKVQPNKEGDFILTFGENERFSVKTDCNSLSGTYEGIEGMLVFSDTVMTKMYCEGSQEEEFAKILENAAGFHFTSKGELVIDLMLDSGTATFR